MDTTTTTCVFAILLGLIPAAIAKNKGHNFFAWWFFGAAFLILALPAALLIKPNVKELEKQQLQGGGMRKCPFCAETIKAEALVCRFCGRELYTTLPTPAGRADIPSERKSSAGGTPDRELTH